nr:hypothetical protein BaRGS_019169 [Batillaria attramentaria]
MSLIKKVVDELELVTFPEIYSTETNQNNDITNLWEHLNDLMNKLTDLENEIGSVEYQNGENSARILDLERTWSSEKYTDVEQDGDVGNLHVAVKDFKSKLFVVLGNEFELFTDKVEVTAGKLAGTKGRERSRMCETGTVTLKADDRKAEYVFQSTFSEVPGVIYSITGLNWNLDARDVQQHFGYGPPPRET